MTKFLKCDLCGSLNPTYEEDVTAKIPYFDDINSEIVTEDLCRSCTNWIRQIVHKRRQEMEDLAK